MSAGEFVAHSGVMALAVASLLISLGMLFRPQQFPRLIVWQAVCLWLICVGLLLIERIWP